MEDPDAGAEVLQTTRAQQPPPEIRDAVDGRHDLCPAMEGATTPRVALPNDRTCSGPSSRVPGPRRVWPDAGSGHSDSREIFRQRRGNSTQSGGPGHKEAANVPSGSPSTSSGRPG